MLYEEQLTEQILAAAIEVHRHLGPGLLESVYEDCLSHELKLHHLIIERQKPITLHYKDLVMNSYFRIDLLVENKVILELKSVEAISPIHMAQILSYMRLSNIRLGLLLNFNVPVLRAGIKRLIL